MSFLDNFLSGYQNDASLDSGPVPTAPQAAGPLSAPARAANPSILDILAATGGQGGTPLPAAPQADMKGILPMALLRFAAQVTQPKQYGQSSANAILQSGSSALEYADHLKRQAAAKAMEEEVNRRRIAESDLRMQGERIGNMTKAQELRISTERAPLDLENMRLKVEAAKSEAELAPFKLRAAKLRDKYAEEIAQAELAEKKAGTDKERAQAAQARAHADLYKKQTEEFLTALESKRKELGRAQVSISKPDVVTGMPEMITVTKPGGLPVGYFRDEMGAEAYALARVRQAKEAAAVTGAKVDEKAIFASAFAEAKKRILPSNLLSEPGATPPPVAPTSESQASAVGNRRNPLVVPQDQEVYDHSIAYSRENPQTLVKVPMPNSKITLQFLGGKEVSGAEVAARSKGRATSGAAPTPSSAMSDKFNAETRAIEQGKRSKYSPDVEEWLRQQDSAKEAGDAAYLAREQARMLKGQR